MQTRARAHTHTHTHAHTHTHTLTFLQRSAVFEGHIAGYRRNLQEVFTAQESRTWKREKDNDHDQDPLPEDLPHIWSWSSVNLLLSRREATTMTKVLSTKRSYTYSHGHLRIIFHFSWVSKMRRRNYHAL